MQTRLLSLGRWLLAFGLSICSAQSQSFDPSAHDVRWTEPGAGCLDSMPLGNGELAANVWTEPDGSLWLLLARADAIDRNGHLLKLGALRVTLEDERDLVEPGEFEQILSLEDGSIELHLGLGEQAATLRVWADVNRPVLWVESQSEAELGLSVELKPWRVEDQPYGSPDVSDFYNSHPEPIPDVIVAADQILESPGGIGSVQVNGQPEIARLALEHQGLDYRAERDPLRDRVFGLLARPLNETTSLADDGLSLSLSAAREHRLAVVGWSEQCVTAAAWQEQVEARLDHLLELDFAANWKQHAKWWQQFWQRSWIVVDSSRSANGAAEGELVSRAYQLQRYVSACAGRGHWPIHFNGSLFTVDYPDQAHGHDFRRWGSGFWWQNTRLPYVGLLASGDFDLMPSLFRFYLEDMAPVARERTERYSGLPGLFLPECLNVWGGVFMGTYGWSPYKERGESLAERIQDSHYHKWEWTSGVELAWMMLQHVEYSGDREFLSQEVIPFANDVLRFFQARFPLDAEERMIMAPMQALETWWNVTDPAPEVAGLAALSEGLLAIADDEASAEDRALWEEISSSLPDLPLRDTEDGPALAPAGLFEDRSNVENPELYPVFPYQRITSSSSPQEQEWAINALHHRWERGHSGWRQDDLFMATLGLSEEARTNLLARAASVDPRQRFPAFWTPNYDWTPDQTHGGVLMRTLQLMLLRPEGKELHLLPAWPTDWDVDFRLHAPDQTVVQGKLHDGQWLERKVTPSFREADLIDESQIGE